MTTRFGRRPLFFALLLVSLPTCRATPTGPALPSLAIITESLPAAMVGVAYAEAVHAEGGDGAFSWQLSAGELPTGLALTVEDLNASQAVITGTPEVAWEAAFTLRVRSGDGQTATRQFTINVLPPGDALSVVTPRVPPGVVSGPYSVRLRTEGGDPDDTEWQLVAGQLPAGLSLSAGGRIHGTPTTVQTTTFTVRATSVGLTAQRSFELRIVPMDVTRFRITVFPVTDVSPALMAHVAQAVAEWEAAVVGNLPPVTIPETFFGPSHCGGFGTQINGTSTDDILLILNIMPIDGPGRVLAQAGPCGLRQTSRLPFAGIVTLDIDDLTPLIGTETLTDIISHEIAHALGFGALWQIFELVQGSGTNEPRFTGPQAVTEYQALGGTGAVPLETQGGEGTAESHWRKSTFGRELMTGFLEPVGIDQPLSRVSIAAQADLGYTVNLGAADAFTLGMGLAVPHADGHLWGELGYDELYPGPVLVLRPDGSAATVELR